MYKDREHSPKPHNRKHSYLYPILSHASGTTPLVPRSPEPLPRFLLLVEELSVLQHPPVQRQALGTLHAGDDPGPATRARN